jgi:hypothetical protein
MILSRPVERAIDQAIELLAAGKLQRGLQALCYLRGRPVPELQAPRRRRLSGVPERDVSPGNRSAARAVCSGAPESRRVRAQPKPPKRLVDPDAITEYNQTHPVCEIRGVDCQGPLDFSHIRAKSAGGDDRDFNGLRLCRWHHRVWHQRRGRWWLRYNERLSAEARAKVLAVYPELAVTPPESARRQ